MNYFPLSINSSSYSLDWSFSTADPNHTLHLNFIDMDEGELIFGYLVGKKTIYVYSKVIPQSFQVFY